MKKYTKIFLALVSVIMLASGCEMKREILGQLDKDKTEKPSTENEGALDLELKPQGEVDLASTKGDAISGSNVVVLDVNEFAIDILDENAKLVKHYDSYADLKKEGVLMLPMGKYSIHAYMGEDVNAGYDAPYYSGTNTCEINPQEVIKIITDCVLSNKKITFKLTDDFQAKFADDYSIVIDNGAGALSSKKTETRSMFLKSTGVLQFTVYSSLRSGNKHLVYHYDLSKKSETDEYNNILVTLDVPADGSGGVDPGPVDPDEPTDPDDPIPPVNPEDTFHVKTPILKVDISLVEKEYIIEIPSDFVDAGDIDNPGGGGTEEPGGGGGTEEPGKPAKPTIVGADGLDIGKPIELSGAGNKTVRVNISTPGKLASLKVKITSSVLEPLLPAVGLSSEFDICDPALKGTLAQLGLSATKGATSTVFDISSFMPMIAGLDSGDYLFTITATDELNQKAAKTLTVRNLNK